jgi:hypothetical protein
VTWTLLALAWGVFVLLEMAGAELDRRSIAELDWRVRHRLFYRP